jgi:8-oxo-dGTP pyrophosphatase MutT (NUDIX family)
VALPLAFKPQDVPVFAVDSHLPVPQAAHLDAQALRTRCASQHEWTPEVRQEAKFSEREPTQASVLIGLVKRERLQVLLTLRPAHMNSHSGQIAFPGGKSDPEDRDAIATALREAQEEVGLDSALVEVIGTMPIYTTGSGFIVTPVVGLVDSAFQPRPNADEVAEVFEVPLDYLMNPAHHRHHVVEMSGVERRWLSMPYMDGGIERFIWGATAGMLRNFYRFVLG